MSHFVASRCRHRSSTPAQVCIPMLVNTPKRMCVSLPRHSILSRGASVRGSAGWPRQRSRKLVGSGATEDRLMHRVAAASCSLPLAALTLSLCAVLALAAAGCAPTAPRPADLTQVGVAEAAQLIREKTVTSTELTQAYIQRANANRDLNAFITLDEAGAMAAA